MNLVRIALASVAMLAIACVAQAQAQDAKFGIQMTLSKPEGDLEATMDNKPGIGFGAHVLIDLRHGHAVVPRFDYTRFTREIDHAHNNISTMSLGADYNYYINARVNEGLYLTGGLAFNNIKAERKSISETTNTVAFSVGAGYMFTRNIGAELKYNNATYSYDGTDYSAPSINATFMYRF